MHPLSQAPQHFTPSQTQATCDGCFVCQSICLVISLDPSTLRTVHPQQSLRVDVEHCHMPKTDPLNTHLLQVEYSSSAISAVPPSLPSPTFVIFDHCCWLPCCCWLPLHALLSSLLLSCFTQCYCKALRAQTRWGALEVFFIIIITNQADLHMGTTIGLSLVPRYRPLSCSAFKTAFLASNRFMFCTHY